MILESEADGPNDGHHPSTNRDVLPPVATAPTVHAVVAGGTAPSAADTASHDDDGKDEISPPATTVIPKVNSTENDESSTLTTANSSSNIEDEENIDTEGLNDEPQKTFPQRVSVSFQLERYPF